MIYMSMRDQINQCLAEGRLFQVFPMLPGSRVSRVLLASPEIYRLVTGPWSDESEEIRCGRLWADFDRFVEGRLISVALDNPYHKPRTTYLARMDPGGDEVWEIRSRDPRPAMRIFGRFAEKDVFVALNWDYRANLGGPGSEPFKIEMRRCKAKWRQCVPTYPAFSGATVDDYSSNGFPV